MCGWREVLTETERNTPFGTDSLLKKEYVVNKDTRICNEDCSNFVRTSIESLINHLVTTGVMTEKQIYNNWKIRSDEIYWSLQWNYRLYDNSFNIRAGMIPSISNYALSWHGITYKSLGGKTLEEIARNQLTQTLLENKIDPRQDNKPKGILGALGGIFGKKQVSGNNV